MPQRWLGVRGSLSFKGLIFGASGLFNFLKYVKYREMSYLSNMILICKCQLPNRPGLSLTRGWGWGGVIPTSRTISPKTPFVLTIPNPKQCNPKHLPKAFVLQPEAVQFQTSPKAFVFQPEAVQSQTCFRPHNPKP